MQLRFFTIPVVDPGDAESELNAFLRSHRVLTVQKELVVPGDGTPFWAVAVDYLASTRGPGKSEAARVDCKEVLEEAEFEAFRRRRQLRKELADAVGRSRNAVLPWHASGPCFPGAS